jgi:hypothetical protein
MCVRILCCQCLVLSFFPVYVVNVLSISLVARHLPQTVVERAGLGIALIVFRNDCVSWQSVFFISW